MGKGERKAGKRKKAKENKGKGGQVEGPSLNSNIRQRSGGRAGEAWMQLLVEN